MGIRQFALLLLCLTIVPAQAGADELAERVPVDQQTEEVVARLVGVMDTSAQATTNSKVANVLMTTCRVKVTDASSQDAAAIFLYQEQGLAQNLDKPYRQRFLRIAPSRYSQSVESLSFRPIELATWIGFCNQPESARVVQRSDLGQPVCSVFLRRTGTAYIGSTPIDGCPAKVRGAVRITNRVILHENGMDTWDRGFDAEGKQVWGAESDSYQFRRR